MSTSLIGSRGPAGGSLQGTASGGLAKNIIPKGYREGRIGQFTPEQMNLFQSLFSQIGPQSYLSRLAGGDEEAFAPMEERAGRDFQDYLGQLGSRFSQLQPGAMSAQRGSGFRNAGSDAAKDFALSLAERRHDLQRQAFQDLMGMSSTLLGQRPYETSLIKREQPFWKQLTGGLVNSFGQGAGQAIGSAAFA